MDDKLKIILCAFVLTLSACSPSSNEDFREVGRSINRSLIKELQGIHTHDDLLNKLPRLEKQFNRLSDVMISAKKFQAMQSGSTYLPLSKEDHQISDQLRLELNRIFLISRGKEMIEKAQQQALDKLDRFEQGSTKTPTATSNRT